MEQDKNGNSQGGPRQRAEALAALNSAFNASPEAKSSTRPSSGGGQGSQRAAAVAALSSVLTAEKKAEIAQSTKSPSSEGLISFLLFT